MAADQRMPPEIVASLVRMGLMKRDENPPFQALTGGVSSDIWRVDLKSGPVCIKRALAQLKVAALWEAPVERNSFELAWMKTARSIVPSAAPEILGEDSAAGMFIMRFLDPREYPLWKAQLRDGVADPDTAGRVGDSLGRIHAATAGDDEVAAAFDTDYIFHSIRLEPYLLATAKAHPDRAGALEGLVETTAQNKRALVHGDVSPKNILIAAEGPVFLDAECAWYGDPAFDLAFCLNHMLLKCLWTPVAARGFMACFQALGAAYFKHVTWEPRADIEGRVARLLPGLFLGRVDGKSPVEYLTEERGKEKVRKVARAFLAEPADRIAAIAAAWEKDLGL